MESGPNEEIKSVKGEKPPGRLFGSIAKRFSRRPPSLQEPVVWARIRGWRGPGILEWGDGTRFGVLPLGSEVVFSADGDGVHVRDGSAKTASIGTPGIADANQRLLRMIEKSLRSRRRFLLTAGILAAGVSLILFLIAASAPGLIRVAALSGSGPGAPAADPLAGRILPPSSMGSGLTCNVH